MSDSSSPPADVSDGGVPETTSDIDALLGNRLDEAACRRFLSEQGSGVLSLAKDGVAYGIPLSFGFDGQDTLYFLLAGYQEPSRKKEFVRATTTASFLTYEGTTREDWRSVIVEGYFEPVPEKEYAEAYKHIEDNAWFPDLFSKADPQGDLEVWRMRAESISGLRGGI